MTWPEHDRPLDMVYNILPLGGGGCAQATPHDVPAKAGASTGGWAWRVKRGHGGSCPDAQHDVQTLARAASIEDMASIARASVEVIEAHEQPLPGPARRIARLRAGRVRNAGCWVARPVRIRPQPPVMSASGSGLRGIQCRAQLLLARLQRSRRAGGGSMREGRRRACGMGRVELRAEWWPGSPPAVQSERLSAMRRKSLPHARATRRASSESVLIRAGYVAQPLVRATAGYVAQAAAAQPQRTATPRQAAHHAAPA